MPPRTSSGATLPVCELAPAKINLTLVVRGRRVDGYHELESLVMFADVHDVVTLEPGAEGSVTVGGPFGRYIGGENLLIRALALLREAEPGLRLGSVRLEKMLPVAAGLGGGSADAAALLRAVRRANPERAANVPWLQVAARLGADVPVCLDARPALMWGVGEKTAPLPHAVRAHAVLVNPGVPLATADVFVALEIRSPPKSTSQPAVPDLTRLDGLIAYMRERGNDLERAATRLQPAVGSIKSALEAEPGCQVAAMTGSGPTCFGIFADQPQARRAADRIAGNNSGWWVRPAALQGTPAA